MPFTDEMRSDLEWWLFFLSHYNDISVIPSDVLISNPELCATDVCLTGCGAVCFGEYFHREFPPFVLAQDLQGDPTSFSKFPQRQNGRVKRPQFHPSVEGGHRGGPGGIHFTFLRFPTKLCFECYKTSSLLRRILQQQQISQSAHRNTYNFASQQDSSGEQIHWVPLDLHINELELLTVVLAVKLWSRKLEGLRVELLSDNATCVLVINSQYSTNVFMQRCLRELWLFLFVASWVTLFLSPVTIDMHFSFFRFFD